MTHTPGPWHDIDQMLQENGRDVLEKCGKAICPHCNKPTYDSPASIQIWAKNWGVAALQSLDPKREHDQHVANARLIAAAPELLEALEDLMLLDFMKRNGHLPCVERARAAIAKATGGQHAE